jgi:hypothetical protein
MVLLKQRAVQSNEIIPPLRELGKLRPPAVGFCDQSLFDLNALLLDLDQVGIDCFHLSNELLLADGSSLGLFGDVCSVIVIVI